MEALNKTRLFNASCVALVVTALAFATRGSFVESWANEFNLTHTQVGWIVGTAFWGFTLAMVFGGPLVDIIGLGRIISIAFVCHVAGTQEAATWAQSQLEGGVHTLRFVAFVPALLVVFFTFLHFWKRKHV